MKKLTMFKICVFLIAVALSYIKGTHDTDNHRRSYYRSLADAQVKSSQAKRLDRASKPLLEYAWLEIKDYINE